MSAPSSTMPPQRSVHIERAARAVQSLAPAVTGAERLAGSFRDALRAGRRGYFTPAEDDRIRQQYADYLTARAALLQTIEELRPVAMQRDETALPAELRIRAFTVAFTAACMLVKAARFILEQARRSEVIRNKLDEASPLQGIPRKQFSSIYASLMNSKTIVALADAIEFAAAQRDEIQALADDPIYAPVLQLLRICEDALDIGERELRRARLRYFAYSWRRRRYSAYRRTMFGIFETAGRVIADMRNPFHQKRIDERICAELGELLRPGDVMITRHDDAMSNLFLPGFWPHAALHIGAAETARSLRIDLDPDRAARWVDPLRVLEARKDGVLLRALGDTLAVDSVAVIRPQLEGDDLRMALGRAMSHEGKLYDFEFDFSRSDRLVCTEVAYRAFDGIGPIRFTLTRRAGRLTFSAEDLLSLALEGRGFEPVAAYGVRGCEDRVAAGGDATRVLRDSYEDLKVEEAVAGGPGE